MPTAPSRFFGAAVDRHHDATIIIKSHHQLARLPPPSDASQHNARPEVIIMIMMIIIMMNPPTGGQLFGVIVLVSPAKFWLPKLCKMFQRRPRKLCSRVPLFNPMMSFNHHHLKPYRFTIRLHARTRGKTREDARVIVVRQMNIHRRLVDTMEELMEKNSLFLQCSEAFCGNWPVANRARLAGRR